MLAISPDGQWLAGSAPGEGLSIWPAAGGPGRRVPGSSAGERPVAFTADGRSLWVWRRSEVPARIFRVNVDTGERRLWKTLMPPDPAGVLSVTEFVVTPDGRSYFYGYEKALSELYVVNGLR